MSCEQGESGSQYCNLCSKKKKHGCMCVYESRVALLVPGLKVNLQVERLRTNRPTDWRWGRCFLISESSASFGPIVLLLYGMLIGLIFNLRNVSAPKHVKLHPHDRRPTLTSLSSRMLTSGFALSRHVKH